MLSFIAAAWTRTHHTPHHFCTEEVVSAGSTELRILVGGPTPQTLSDTIRAAVSDSDADRVTIAVLPRMTPDTPEQRMWRMRLQRTLRAESARPVSVEYERWR